ncbi:pilus assembly protein PilQ [Buttiauxella sp. B2]|uniref:GspE/PulE family protein n=1 Tax=Buttiauxella sp. B2 TaxID=2587812 RepID=UPI001120B849|nr:ATPase, T2SS/T4P/T4SS family [Buttiauxella sp. B2]TNV16095.1 pilus assembly protein PilQ [Buttiauxella sp. B2]
MSDIVLDLEKCTIRDIKSVIGNNSLSGIEESVCLMERMDGGYWLLVADTISTDANYYDFLRVLKDRNVRFEKQFLPKKEIIEWLRKKKDTVDASNNDMSLLQKKIRELFEKAADMNASDIHLRIYQKYYEISFRVDGKLRRQHNLNFDAETNGQMIVNALYNSMCEGHSATSVTFTEPMDARVREEFVHQFGLSGGRFSSRPGGNNELLVVVRLIKRRDEALTLSDLGMTQNEQEAIERIINRPSGVTFFSGPTGHGKSTLAQCIAEMVIANDSGLNMITVEDPIESIMKGPFQTQLTITDRSDRVELSRAWGKAISSLLRLDPDWIYQGEARDQTSAMGVTEAAQTGHNVMTTIHTAFPIDIMSRLKNFGVDDDLLTDASLITCLIGLRLVPLLCPECKVPYRDKREKVPVGFQKVIDTWCDTESVYMEDESGCKHCNYTGIKGRTGIFEIIETDATFMNEYHQNGKMSAYSYWYKKGGLTLCDNMTRLINDGRIDPITAHKNTCNLDRDSQMFTPETFDFVRKNRQAL